MAAIIEINLTPEAKLFLGILAKLAIEHGRQKVYSDIEMQHRRAKQEGQQSRNAKTSLRQPSTAQEVAKGERIHGSNQFIQRQREGSTGRSLQTMQAQEGINGLSSLPESR